MSLPKGYAGKVAIIDLTKPEAAIMATDRFFKKYGIEPRLWIGGDGFITKILWEDYAKPIDPLGAENEIIIATGPWTATAAQQSGRAMLGCISPETGGFSSGSFGWYWAAALKYAGYDLVIVRGKSEKPVYVFIDDGDISFRDASRIWGKETGETVKMIREELGERFESEIRVMSISVAGENLVRYAPPITDGTSAPGRSGGGTVMGSKKLKAIAVRGTGEIQLYNARGLLETSYNAVNKFLTEEPTLKLWKEQGATTDLSVTAQWPMNGSALGVNRSQADHPLLNNAGCLNCQSPCYHWLQIKEGKYAGLRQLGGHMTFLTTALRNLDITNFNEWIYYERLTQELGFDPASFSMAFSFLVDCFEKGLITTADTDGLVLKRGDAELVFDVARRTAHRQGKLGNMMADGIAETSKKIGKEAEAIAYHVHGKPSIQRDSRLQALIWSLGYITSPRGGDWLRVHNVWELAFLPERRDTFPQYIGMTCTELYDKSLKLLDMPLDLKKRIFGDPPKVDADWVRGTKGKALFTVWTENFVGLFNSLVTCMFGAATEFLMTGYGPTTYADILSKITGWDVTYDELMAVGERVINLQRAFNYRLKGWEAKDDRFNEKQAYEPATVGIYRGKLVPWDTTLKEYYAERGWSERGIPTKAKMRDLKMGDLLDKIDLPD